jgi:ABC-type multidrug transport system fused ATPase/permease subunit
VQPSVHDPLVTAVSPPAGAAVRDPQSGFEAVPGQLTALVSAYPEESAELADRLGRFGTRDGDAGNQSSGGAQLGGVPLSALPLSEVRRRIVVSETEPRLFTGVLRDELIGPGGAALTDEDIWSAVEVASAADAVDALPDGLGSRLEERGRSLSGGQRQRLALARALLRDAETLVLVEPTSAVDAHTEARIGQRLHDARSGRSTVVITSSPLLLEHADRVVFLAGGRVRASGTHDELLATTPAYRSVVTRGEEG